MFSLPSPCQYGASKTALAMPPCINFEMIHEVYQAPLLKPTMYNLPPRWRTRAAKVATSSEFNEPRRTLGFPFAYQAVSSDPRDAAMGIHQRATLALRVRHVERVRGTWPATAARHVDVYVWAGIGSAHGLRLTETPEARHQRAEYFAWGKLTPSHELLGSRDNRDRRVAWPAERSKSLNPEHGVQHAR